MTSVSAGLWDRLWDGELATPVSCRTRPWSRLMTHGQPFELHPDGRGGRRLRLEGRDGELADLLPL